VYAGLKNNLQMIDNLLKTEKNPKPVYDMLLSMASYVKGTNMTLEFAALLGDALGAGVITNEESMVIGAPVTKNNEWMDKNYETIKTWLENYLASQETSTPAVTTTTPGAASSFILSVSAIFACILIKLL
jgi:hypothetical protein